MFKPIIMNVNFPSKIKTKTCMFEPIIMNVTFLIKKQVLPCYMYQIKKNKNK